jgi:biopolymer transport protein ExbD
MNLNPNNKVDPGFSMASMTDLIFLLLVFFMLTSSFVTPSGLAVNTPSTKASAAAPSQNISVRIGKDLQYYVNDRKISKSDLEAELRKRLTPDGSVVLRLDPSVPSEHLVYVAGITTYLKAKVVLM